ncbi:hypothetical protein [uncultured Desulfuromonas sp.]|uniref:hypothetical protein n=1 Tax=uncultured Desulfuromonas sp. TaxID=181013 RepID=UPI002AAC2CE8|nr:hypothetical protein [uncultured Desulfuromonas sp.]
MIDRTKLLVHLRRLSGLFENAFRNGPDGTLEGKFASEQPVFIHHGCAFYLAGCLAFLEGEDGAYSWNIAGASSLNFDTFVDSYPAPPKDNYGSRRINKANMNALAQVRNAVVHHDGDLARNRNKRSVAMVTAANLPGVLLSGSVVTLEAPFFEYVRVATLAVRNYHGEF